MSSCGIGTEQKKSEEKREYFADAKRHKGGDKKYVANVSFENRITNDAAGACNLSLNQVRMNLQEIDITWWIGTICRHSPTIRRM